MSNKTTINVAKAPPTINKILNSKKDVHAEMIGFETAAFFDAAARQPEIIDQLTISFEYITNSIFKVNEKEVYSLAYASQSFYNSYARQPDAGEDIWASFKTYIDNLASQSK